MLKLLKIIKLRQSPPVFPNVAPASYLAYVSELTQQDGRKNWTPEHLCVTNLTLLFLASFVVIFT